VIDNSVILSAEFYEHFGKDLPKRGRRFKGCGFPPLRRREVARMGHGGSG
jgi:hypothetical protein